MSGRRWTLVLFVVFAAGLAACADTGAPPQSPEPPAVAASLLETVAAWQVEPDQASAEMGYSVSSAGDVNGDGYSDVIVGARLYDSGQSNEGRAFVYLGSATGLSTTAAWTAESDQANALFGFSVAGVGDVDGDGYGDVVVGARSFDNGETNEGRAFLYLGSATGLAATPAWTAEPNVASALFGSSVAAAGDVNSDGFADVIVGAPGYTNGESDEGGAWLYLGSASGLSATAAWSAEPDTADTNYGSSVSSAGDVNGDGFGDVIVGAVGYDNGESNEGAAFVYLGSASGLDTLAVWSYEPDVAGAGLGNAVSSAGDVDGDGFSEVLVGASAYNGGEAGEGRAFLFNGSPGGPGAAPSWTYEPNEAGAGLGTSVSAAGDVNGDGYADILVGAPLRDNGETNEGLAYLFLGSLTGLSLTPDWSGEADVAFASFGGSVSAAGDVDGDGFGDVIIGARTWTNVEFQEGSAFVFQGVVCTSTPSSRPCANALTEYLVFTGDVLAATGLGSGVAAEDLTGDGEHDYLMGTGINELEVWADPANFATWVGGQAGSAYGESTSGAGDVDGDGYGDFLIGARLWDSGEVDEGRVELWRGALGFPSDPLPAWTGEPDQAGAEYGAYVASAGDVNADGFGDVLVGAPLFDNGETDEGRAYLYLGSPAGLLPTPSWTAESDQAGAELGVVAAAGDVNGDGFGDVLVGAPLYDDTWVDGGRVWLYLGSATGLATSPAWTAEPEFSFPVGPQLFGSAVSAAGDINGDGFGDIIIGAPDDGSLAEGAVYVYLGSPSGPSVSLDWFATGSAFAGFGSAVSWAGDVNGDGLGDVVIGSPDVGRVDVYVGGATGLGSTPWWSLSLAAGTEFGHAVASAGDRDFDGLSDLIISAPLDSGLPAGAVRVYANQLVTPNPVLPLEQLRSDGMTRIGVGVGVPETTVTFTGRVGDENGIGGLFQLEVEIKPVGVAFDGSATVLSPPEIAGSVVLVTAAGLTVGPKHWRARVRYPVETGAGRWLAFGGNTEVVPDFIVKLADGDPCGFASDCASSFCVDGVCCDTACDLDCDACNVAGSEGTCTDDDTLCTGNCDVCSAGSCASDIALCTGNCDVCTGGGTAFDCAPDPAACPGDCEDCAGGGNDFSCTFLPNTTLCNPVNGPCDVAETCTGASPSCPPDGFDTGTVCNPVAGPCDIAESCDGTGPACPPDGFDTGTLCNPAAGPCDLAESCDGTGPACPMDTFVMAGTLCNPSSDVCELDATCDGMSAGCPANPFVAMGTVCRPAADPDCDLLETCTGTAAACPGDQVAPAGTVCRTMADICDAEETCDGIAATCPSDGFAGSAVECRPSTDACDPAEQCNGIMITCPGDVNDDADDDTICGTADNCPLTPNLLQSDLDMDGIGDACDPDADGDGLTDLDEPPIGLSPANPDTDGDLIDDGDETGNPMMPTDTNMDGTIDGLDDDSDGDGVLDIDEAGDMDLSTPPVDTDGDMIPDFQDPDSDDDGIGDGMDNCRLVVNPLQADTNMNGIGDACETPMGTDAGVGTDSGVPGTDSGAVGTDAGMTGTDAGMTGTDSGVPPGTDAGGMMGTDSGTEPPREGCNCRVVTAPAPDAGPLVLLGALLLGAAVRFRRRRALRQPGEQGGGLPPGGDA